MAWKQTIRRVDCFQPFKYQTSPLFGSPLCLNWRSKGNLLVQCRTRLGNILKWRHLPFYTRCTDGTTALGDFGSNLRDVIYERSLTVCDKTSAVKFTDFIQKQKYLLFRIYIDAQNNCNTKKSTPVSSKTVCMSDIELIAGDMDHITPVTSRHTGDNCSDVFQNSTPISNVPLKNRIVHFLTSPETPVDVVIQNKTFDGSMAA